MYYIGLALGICWVIIITTVNYSRWQKNYRNKKLRKAAERRLEAEMNMRDHCATKEDMEVINRWDRSE